MEAGEIGPAGYPGDNGRIGPHMSLFHDLAGETGTDDAIADERLGDLQLPSGVKSSHPRARAGAAGGTVHGVCTKDRRVASQQKAVRLPFGRPMELHCVNSCHKRQLWVLYRKLLIGQTMQMRPQAGQRPGVSGDQFQAHPRCRHQDEKSAAVDDVHQQFAQFRHSKRGIQLMDKNRGVVKGDLVGTALLHARLRLD